MLAYNFLILASAIINKVQLACITYTLCQSGAYFAVCWPSLSVHCMWLRQAWALLRIWLHPPAYVWSPTLCGTGTSNCSCEQASAHANTHFRWKLLWWASYAQQPHSALHLYFSHCYYVSIANWPLLLL